jgi:hypothetical protein
VADGGGQWSSGEVVEWGEEQECDACEGIEERRSFLGVCPSEKEAHRRAASSC